MDVVFYNFKYKKNAINKVIPSGTTVSCEIKDGASIEAPVLYMRKNNNIINCNYAYIREWHRYYFVEPPEVVGPDMYITLREDYLQSWKSDILSSTGTATRSNFYNKNIPDKMVASLPGENIQYRTLSSAFTGETYVLILGGK